MFVNMDAQIETNHPDIHVVPALDIKDLLQSLGSKDIPWHDVDTHRTVRIPNIPQYVDLRHLTPYTSRHNPTLPPHQSYHSNPADLAYNFDIIMVTWGVAVSVLIIAIVALMAACYALCKKVHQNAVEYYYHDYEEYAAAIQHQQQQQVLLDALPSYAVASSGLPTYEEVTNQRNWPSSRSSSIRRLQSYIHIRPSPLYTRKIIGNNSPSNQDNSTTDVTIVMPPTMAAADTSAVDEATTIVTSNSISATNQNMRETTSGESCATPVSIVYENEINGDNNNNNTNKISPLAEEEIATNQEPLLKR